MGNFKELLAYKKAFQLAMEIFKVTCNFPADEKYGLTSQIRRSSRSVCSNFAEGYRKRRYKAHFISKLTDADMENTETMVWIDFALSCEYIDRDTRIKLYQQSEEIGKLLSYMIDHPEKFIWKE
ncbi:MAG: four helix bundle protein [Bacteroidales bacterium]|nr:four helix bundle protein [Bacteroidales bacterium]